MRRLKIKVKNKKLSLSSKKWLERQLNDPFVHKAKVEGYRSRAAYKLQEIQEKYHLIQKGMIVIDLGAAPGGWCQILSGILKGTGHIYAVDLLGMDPVPDVTFVQGDFNDIKEKIKDKVDVILSDMAPSACGVKSVDHLRLMGMLEEVFDFAKIFLKPGGALVAKVLRGGTEGKLLAELKKAFRKVTHFKPDSSRSESAEIYVLAQGFRLQSNPTET